MVRFYGSLCICNLTKFHHGNPIRYYVLLLLSYHCLVNKVLHICRRTDVDGYKLLVRDTCRLYLGDIITIYLCHGRLVSLCIQQQKGHKLATILSPIQDTCRRRQVYTTYIRQHVSRWKRGIMSIVTLRRFKQSNTVTGSQ